MKRVCGVCACVCRLCSKWVYVWGSSHASVEHVIPTSCKQVLLKSQNLILQKLTLEFLRKGRRSFQHKPSFFFLFYAITPEHSLDCCQDLPCKTWFLFSRDGHFYGILFVTTGTSEGIWWHQWMLLPQFLLIHFQHMWFLLIRHLCPLSHTFSFSP